MSLLASSCSNSKMVLSPLYNRVDDQIRDEFNKLGDFEDWQKERFEERLQTFHYWHRRDELPRYAELIAEVGETITRKRSVTPAHAARWANSIEQMVHKVQSCYPAHYSIDLMKTLKPAQIAFIERRFAREQRKNRAKYSAKTRDERMTDRVKQIGRWANLAGFRLTREQRKLIRAHMDETKSLHESYYVLTGLWNQELFKKLRNTNSPQYTQRVSRHLQSLYSLMDRHHSETLEYNRDVWRRFIVAFDQSLSADQRIWLSSYFKTLAKTTRSISRANVSFVPHSDSAKGCIAKSDV